MLMEIKRKIKLVEILKEYEALSEVLVSFTEQARKGVTASATADVIVFINAYSFRILSLMKEEGSISYSEMEDALEIAESILTRLTLQAFDFDVVFPIEMQMFIDTLETVGERILEVTESLNLDI